MRDHYGVSCLERDAVVKFRPYTPDQLLLLPPNLRDWISEGHLALFVSDTVDSLDLSEFVESYEHETGRGNPAYHPAMMLKVLLYGYCVGVMSSRKIEKACWDDVAFRVLSADQHPDFNSIARFRKRHLAVLPKLFKQVLKLAQAAGLVKLGVVALDGTKMKANASKHKAMSYERMVENEKRLEKEIAELLDRAQTVDKEEDSRYGADKRGDELPAELVRRESRLAAIQKAKAALEEEARLMAEAERREQLKKEKQREKDKGGKPPRNAAGGRKGTKELGTPKPGAQRNFTDPDSRIMWHTSSKSFEQSYNAQAAVDAEAQIIVAAGLSQDCNDKKQLIPMIKEARRNTDGYIGAALADCGYFSEKNVTDKSLEDVELLIPPEREKHGQGPSDVPRGRIPKAISTAAKMIRKLKTTKAKKLYKQRKAIVEPVFGQIKHARGIRQFLLRGLENVKHEWELICLTHNLKKMFTGGWRPATA
jgi:transposase